MARQVKVLMDVEINHSFKETSIGEKRFTELLVYRHLRRFHSLL